MIPQIEFKSQKCWRIIPSRFPPVNLFQRVAAPTDLEIVQMLEAMTNSRLREYSYYNQNVVERERPSTFGTSYIMSTFTHVNPIGSRFTDGTWGVYYASHNIETAIKETCYHRERFLKATDLPPLRFDMRVLVAYVSGKLDDITAANFKESGIYDPDSYHLSQRFARELLSQGSNGIFYSSLREPKGYNMAVFKPNLLSDCHQAEHLEYIWDGKRINFVFEKRLKAS
jgi:hypothetical protein